MNEDKNIGITDRERKTGRYAMVEKEDKQTINEFRDAVGGRGESVMNMAFLAVARSVDDEELIKAAHAALKAEDEFSRLLADRGIFA